MFGQTASAGAVDRDCLNRITGWTHGAFAVGNPVAATRLCAASLFYSDASADGVKERLLVLRSRSHARLRRNATMSHALSCVQPTFIDL
ncbi:hypothetical protein EVAR_16561_1 [Eumeta japonica]|uniref:Uncharacterized protein n=1 Tax=Eumeta variegata TaxID=151549 RepID=A0A4C1U346_EUMVA|nr:hypothetical protein EVAR_16561_1 [Eumeta japonica]